jgi:hypothetical protein
MAVLEELKRLSDERFFSIYEALVQQGFGPLDGEVARSLKFRPQAIRKLPMEKRARQARKLLSTGSRSELAYELFGSYLVRTQKELVCDFLDQTGVPHEDGMIDNVADATPDPEKVPEAITALDEKFATEDVTLYLALGVEMWPDCEILESLWRERSGVSS